MADCWRLKPVALGSTPCGTILLSFLLPFQRSLESNGTDRLWFDDLCQVLGPPSHAVILLTMFTINKCTEQSNTHFINMNQVRLTYACTKPLRTVQSCIGIKYSWCYRARIIQCIVEVGTRLHCIATCVRIVFTNESFFHYVLHRQKDVFPGEVVGVSMDSIQQVMQRSSELWWLALDTSHHNSLSSAVEDIRPNTLSAISLFYGVFTVWNHLIETHFVH